MRGSRGGGVPGQSDKKNSYNVFFSFLVLSLFYRSQMVKIIIFQFFKVPEGVQHFPGGGGGGPTFSRGGGRSNCLFPIETHISCDFPGGSGPPVPRWIRT